MEITEEEIDGPIRHLWRFRNGATGKISEVTVVVSRAEHWDGSPLSFSRFWAVERFGPIVVAVSLLT